MAQSDRDDFVLPSRGALQRLKDNQMVDKEIDQQLSGLAASSEVRARLAETSRSQRPGKLAFLPLVKVSFWSKLRQFLPLEINKMFSAGLRKYSCHKMARSASVASGLQCK